MDKEINKFVRQSQVRVRSGIRLIAFLLLVVTGAFFLDILWVVKIGWIAIGFFCIVTLFEYWNVRRLKLQQKDNDRE